MLGKPELIILCFVHVRVDARDVSRVVHVLTSIFSVLFVAMCDSTGFIIVTDPSLRFLKTLRLNISILLLAFCQLRRTLQLCRPRRRSD